MTQTNGHGDRLDRLEALMASQLEFNRQISEQMAATQRQTEVDRQYATADREATHERMTDLERVMAQIQNESLQLQRQFSGMTQALGAMAHTQVQLMQKFDQVHNEIIGLQTENRRILDHLFGQSSN